MSTLPSPIAMLGDLVALPSVAAHDPALDQSNRPVVDRLAEWADQVGFDVEVLDVPALPGKVNLVATLGTGDGGLVLSGHTDTVPWDRGAWSSDPFMLTERDGRLFGLGATDMKGFFAVALAAIRSFRPDQLKEPLILLGTADEETTMSGARALLAAGRIKARRAVIGEPTSLQPIRMHKGIAFESIRVRGKAGDSSKPALGANALEGMHQAISAILDYRVELQSRFRNDAFEVPVPTINLGRIQGGDAPNRICASCELQIDFRPLPGMDLECFRTELHERVQRAVAHPKLIVEFSTRFHGVPAFETPADASIVRAAAELTGTEPGTVMFATESPFFQRMGLETIVLGCGDIRVAHQPDEYLPIESIEPGIRVYQQLIHRFCVELRE